MFTIAHIQDPVVQFASARGLTFMRPLWASWFSSVESLLAFHYLDYHNAFTLAANYSSQLAKDADESGSDDYFDIVALSARQAMGATTFAGTPENPILFIKEISSNGNFQTIDVIFPAFPFFLYTNPRWLTYMLEPLIEHMLSGQYPNKYAMHDLGYHFPNATGHADGRDEYMPVEECGNILIMGLAIVNSLTYDTDEAAGSIWASMGSQKFDANPATSAFSLNNLEERDGIFGLDDSWGGSTKGVKQAQKWVNRSYRLWKQWTGYLVEFSLEPLNQRMQTSRFNPSFADLKQYPPTTSPAPFDSRPTWLSRASSVLKPWKASPTSSTTKPTQDISRQVLARPPIQPATNRNSRTSQKPTSPNGKNTASHATAPTPN